MLWLSRLDQVDPAGRVKVFVWRNVGSARRVTLPPQKGEPAARRVILLAKHTFLSHLHGSPPFLRDRMKSWLTVGGGLALLPGTTFLHINGPKKAETDSHGMGLCYTVQPDKLK